MADDDKKQEDVKQAEDAAEEAEKSAEKAEEAKEEAQESAEQAQEAVEEVKEQKPSQPSEPSKPSKPKIKVSAKLEKIIGEIEKLQVLELSELVKALEEKFGVTAAAPVATAAAVQAGTDEGVSEQTTFNVILAESGANKISVIKAIRELVPTLGLKEAKDLVDAAPKQVLEGVNKETATEAKLKLETAGGKVELK